MTTRISLLLLAAVIAYAPAQAQSHADAMARLAPFEGTYVLDGEAQIEEGSFTGTLSIAPTLGGHFQEWTWTMSDTGQGVPTHLRFIVTYDEADQRYRIWRFDTRDVDGQGGDLGNEVAGSLQVDGNTLVMTWPSRNPDAPEQTGRFRNTVRLVPQGLDVMTDAMPDSGGPAVAIATTRAARQ